jgi:RNA polymerase sigma factor (sigma-70 family)
MNRNDQDEGQFNNLYEGAFPTLIKVAYHITHDMGAAEDICQEAFIRYYNRAIPFPSDQQALYWLIRVVKNLSFNFRKRKVREYNAVEQVRSWPDREEPTGEDIFLQDETVQIVRDALEKLPEKYKTVLVMKEYTDLSYQDIGKILRISESNVKVRVHRARKHLESLIDEEDVHVR